VKIAVTATSNDPNGQVDPRFGRAKYFLIFDDDGNLLETYNNSDNLNAMGGAGIQAGKVLSDRKVDVLLTGHCGPNAYKVLNAAGVKVGIEVDGTVQDALERFRKNNVKFADAPNVEGHW
jgi:predicted Fe-Mo cluster-binding NifX family protein